MKKVCKRAGIWGILLGIMLFAVGFTLQATTVETQAAAITGFRTINGKTYYYKNGKRVKGWLTLGNNKSEETTIISNLLQDIRSVGLSDFRRQL